MYPPDALWLLCKTIPLRPKECLKIEPKRDLSTLLNIFDHWVPHSSIGCWSWNVTIANIVTKTRHLIPINIEMMHIAYVDFKCMVHAMSIY